MRKVRLLTLCISTALLAPASGAYELLPAQEVESAGRLRGGRPHDNPVVPARARISRADDSFPVAESPLPADIEVLERRCLDEINRLRQAHRLAPLEHSKELLVVARSHSRRMSEEGFFSHTDPQGLSTRERVNRAGIKWKSVAENIASSSGYTNPVAVSMHGWMSSAGHRRNILSQDFNLTAVGVWISATGAVYFTEIFLKR